MDNTVVTASDMNYFWGVLLLAASMRCHGMQEPIIVSAIEYTDQAKDILKQLPGIDIVDVPRGRYSLTCQKPDAMLLAKTKYVTWVDCDGFFHGNCSKLLTPDNEHEIHIRKRSLTENRRVYPESASGAIPDDVLELWQKDVRERSTPRINTCCSCCLLSVATRQRTFLERWREQMNRVLPEGDVGVVDHRSKAYFQTDESVLNSLLCFLQEAPDIAANYKLDKNPEAFFIHFVAHPKPWKGWTSYAFQHFDRYAAIAEYLVNNNLKLPGPLPWTLKKQNKLLCKLLIHPLFCKHKMARLTAKIKQHFHPREKT